MEKTNPNDPAFSRAGFAITPEDYDLGAPGITKREYFAAKALTGLCLQGAFDKAIQRQVEKVGSTTSEALATYAVDLADALIKALNREEELQFYINGNLLNPGKDYVIENRVLILSEETKNKYLK